MANYLLSVDWKNILLVGKKKKQKKIKYARDGFEARFFSTRAYFIPEQSVTYFQADYLKSTGIQLPTFTNIQTKFGSLEMFTHE